MPRYANGSECSCLVAGENESLALDAALSLTAVDDVVYAVSQLQNRSDAFIIWSFNITAYSLFGNRTVDIVSIYYFTFGVIFVLNISAVVYIVEPVLEMYLHKFI